MKEIILRLSVNEYKLLCGYLKVLTFQYDYRSLEYKTDGKHTVAELCSEKARKIDGLYCRLVDAYETGKEV